MKLFECPKCGKQGISSFRRILLTIAPNVPAKCKNCDASITEVIKTPGVSFYRVILARVSTWILFLPIAGRIIEDILSVNIPISTELKNFYGGYFGGYIMSLGGFLFWERINIGSTYRYFDEYESTFTIPKFYWFLIILFSIMFSGILLFEDPSKTTWHIGLGVLISGAIFNQSVAYLLMKTRRKA